MLSLSLLLVGTASARAADLSWSDLSELQGAPLQLRQPLHWERGSFSRGDEFYFESEMPLEGIGVMLLELRSQKCANPAATGDMQIVRPEGSATDRDASVGVTLDPGCRIEVYVEDADYMGMSLFASSDR